jgi:predicted metalloprotease with PDZ domain
LDAGGTATGEPIPQARDLMRMSNFKRRQYFDRRAARAAGLSEAEIDRVFEEWAEAEHEIHQRIAANHAAGRRVRPGTRSYDKQLREFLDDEDYDLALYATGQRNRVELVAPAPGRGEMAAGLQPGDLVESYDGQPVFRLTELQQMIKRTGYGTDVPVVVRRGGEIVELTVPGKHPLGPKTSERAAPMPR